MDDKVRRLINETNDRLRMLNNKKMITRLGLSIMIFWNVG